VICEPDFRLDGLRPADTASDLAAGGVWTGDLSVLVEHHTADDPPTSFLIAHDGSATWGVPGAPQLLAIKITRDLERRTFTFETASHATLPFAQRWLVERGCAPEPIAQVGNDFMQPADDATLRAEQQIRASGDRYHVLDTWTSDGDDSCETWTMVHDAQAVRAPVRVFLEEADLDAFTYTLREGAFPSEAAAWHWLENRDGPLPTPPEHRGTAADLRSRVALTRSSASPSPAAGADHAALAAPTMGANQRLLSGRAK
jgi:hypothetical protein